MVILNSNDVFSVKLATLIADYDHETLTNLYQPLVGHNAIALYFTFLGEASLQRVSSSSNHESLLAKMQISVGDFLKARKALEGVGLLRTYLEEVNGAKIFHYEIYAPKTPDEFFNDTLLYGLLINYIGEVDAKKLNKYYAVSTSVNGQEVSASFKEVFHPDFESNAFLKALNSNPSLGRNRAKMKLEFTYERFFEALKEVSQISEKAFSKAELSEIMRLASLNGVDESTAAHIVANNYDSSLEKGKRVDLANVKKAFQEETSGTYLSSFNRNKITSTDQSLVSSNGNLNPKIKLMEEVTPKQFLYYLQGGIAPASADLNLIDFLSSKFKLPNSVLNVVIDYTLMKNDNILSKAYAEKICASLVRSQATNSYDAMNYLLKTSKKKSSSDNSKNYNEENSRPTPKKNVSIDPKETEREWEEIFAVLEDNEDKNNGKA